MYIINKAGGLIFSHDQPIHSPEVEVSFAYPIGGLVLEEVDRNVMVKFGEQRHPRYRRGGGGGAYGLYRTLLPKVQEGGLMAYTVPCCPHSMYGIEGTSYFRVLYRGGCAVTNEASGHDRYTARMLGASDCWPYLFYLS